MNRWLLMAALALSGCDKAKAPESPQLPAIPSAEAIKIEQLTERVKGLEDQMSYLDFSADLKLGNDGWQKVQGPVGALTLKWIKSEKLGAGSRLTFQIGNPSTASLYGVKLYGWATNAEGRPDAAFPNGGLQLQGDAGSGKWTVFSVVFDERTPDQIKAIHISSVGAETIGLQR